MRYVRCGTIYICFLVIWERNISISYKKLWKLLIDNRDDSKLYIYAADNEGKEYKKLGSINKIRKNLHDI